MPALHDSVALLEDLGDLKRGLIGTIVDIYDDGVAFEVEFPAQERVETLKASEVLFLTQGGDNMVLKLPIEEAKAEFETLVHLLGACATDSMEVADRNRNHDGTPSVWAKQAEERVNKVRTLLRGDDILYSPVSPLNVILGFAAKHSVA